MICPNCKQRLQEKWRQCPFCHKQLAPKTQPPHQEEQDIERMISPNILEVPMPQLITIEESPEIVLRFPRVIRMRILGWKTIPEVDYKIPILPVEREPQKEKGWLGGLIEGEGSFFESTDVRKGYVRRRAGFLTRMTENPPIARAGKHLGITPHPFP
ncbi:MAG: hypothetical protein KIH10_17710, partial [Candidatus Freyarchaeota archaeon]|nr:hypothetical protein [Candidatus Jordarchaeia archaeon]